MTPEARAAKEEWRRKVALTKTPVKTAPAVQASPLATPKPADAPKTEPKRTGSKKSK